VPSLASGRRSAAHRVRNHTPDRVTAGSGIEPRRDPHKLSQRGIKHLVAPRGASWRTTPPSAGRAEENGAEEAVGSVLARRHPEETTGVDPGAELGP
jgi:hypothetical protein